MFKKIGHKPDGGPIVKSNIIFVFLCPLAVLAHASRSHGTPTLILCKFYLLFNRRRLSAACLPLLFDFLNDSILEINLTNAKKILAWF